MLHALGVEAHARIAHGHTHTIAVLPFGSDQQLPRAIVHADHRVRGVAEQVQDDLLELDAIAGDDREIVGELRLKNDPVSLQLAQRQRNDLSRGLVQIQRLERELLLAEQRTQPRDHIRGAVAIANRPPRGFARAVDVRRIGIQHPKARTGVGDDARERLVDLMGDRGGQRAQGRDPRHMRELGAGPVQGLLRDHALRHVLQGADEHRATLDLLDDMGDAAHMLHGAAGGHDAEGKIRRPAPDMPRAITDSNDGRSSG